MKVLDHFDTKTAKTIGAFFLWGLLCFAIGNGHATQEAIKGSEHWWQTKEHRDVNASALHQQAVDLGIAPK